MKIQNAVVLFLVTILVLNSGCASYVTYKKSEKELYQGRILASGDERAMNALKAGVPPKQAIRAVDISNGVGIGIDLAATDIITEHPWLQAGAALLDAAIIYGAKEGIDHLNEHNSSSASTPVETDVEASGINIEITGSADTTVNINTGDSGSSSSSQSTSVDNSDSSDNSDNN